MTDCKTARLEAKGDSPESNELLKQLRLPIAAKEPKKVADRLQQLRKLFGGLAPDRAKKLLVRLNDPKDLLGIFFDCGLSADTRKELRDLLAKDGASQKPANPRGIDNRATNAPAVTNRSTTAKTAGAIERALSAALQGAVSGGTSAASGSQPAIDCAAQWQTYETTALNVISRAKPTEHRLRNMLITAHYALLYLGNHELKWAGFAAYASKQVGCAMDHTQRIARLAMAGGTYYPMKQNDEDALDSWDELATMIGAGADIAGLANFMYAKLGEGNQKLFLDIYPPHLFFIDHGYKALAQCAKARKPALSSQLLEGFRLIEESRTSAKRLTLLRDAVAEMARHEQLNILQHVIYNNSKTRAILDLNESDLPGTDPAKAILTSECTDPGEKNTYYLNDTGMGDKELYNPTDRMEWILDRIAPHYFALEGTAQHIADLKVLTRILYY